MSLENNLANLVVEQRRIVEVMEYLYSEINILQNSLVEHQNALDILEMYKTSKDSEFNTLLPIGGGVYLPVIISKPDIIVVNVGSGVFLEKSVAEAIERVKRSMENIRNAVDKRLKTLQQLKNRYEEVTSVIAELQFKLQKKGR